MKIDDAYWRPAEKISLRDDNFKRKKESSSAMLNDILKESKIGMVIYFLKIFDEPFDNSFNRVT